MWFMPSIRAWVAIPLNKDIETLWAFSFIDMRDNPDVSIVSPAH
jgi:hypothetical protein